MGYLIPGQKRRLAAEQAIYNRFPNFKECGKACNAYCKARMLNITFNDMAVHQYVGCKTNFSVPRLKILAAVLGVTDLVQLDEVFVAPNHRGEGLPWVGESGRKVPDLVLPKLE